MILQSSPVWTAIRSGLEIWDRTISQSPKNSGPDRGVVQFHFLGPDYNASLRYWLHYGSCQFSHFCGILSIVALLLMLQITATKAKSIEIRPLF